MRPHLPTHPCPNAKGSWEGCQANLPLSRTSSGLEAGGRATTGSGESNQRLSPGHVRCVLGSARLLTCCVAVGKTPVLSELEMRV